VANVQTLECAPEVAGPDADDRVRLRVEGFTAAEHFDSDRIALDAVATSQQGFLNYMAEKALLAAGGIEVRAVEDQGKLGAAILNGEIMLPCCGCCRLDQRVLA
jgi:hypothetical protein